MKIKELDLRVASLCLGSDEIGFDGRHSVTESLFTEYVSCSSTLGSRACAKRERIGTRIPWLLCKIELRRSPRKAVAPSSFTESAVPFSVDAAANVAAASCSAKQL